MSHFGYLLKDDHDDFFAEFSGMEKSASTIGELVGKATNGSLSRATDVPRATEVLKPRLRRIQKMASETQLRAELELLKIAGSMRGTLGMTKAAADLMAEFESDPQATEQALDAAFNVLLASSLEHDIEQMKTAMPAKTASAIGASIIKEALIGAIARGVGKFLRGAGEHEVARAAESGIARTGGKAIGHIAEGLEGAAPALASKAKNYSGKLLTQAGEAEAMPTAQIGHKLTMPGAPAGSSSSPRASAMKDAIDTGMKHNQEETSATKKIDMGTTPRNNIPHPQELENVAKGRVNATEAGAEAPKAGYMNSLNKFMRGEKLEPEERAHVFKLGLGAVVADRALTHMQENNQ